MIRYAALHRLCLDLGYGGSRRLIEPYSLRLTRDGHILLCARKAESHELRTYRLDSIERVRLTDVHFDPVYAIEMTAGGPIMFDPPLEVKLRDTRPT